MKKSKAEIKQELKKDFTKAKTVSALKNVIQKMHEYGVSTDDLIDN